MDGSNGWHTPRQQRLSRRALLGTAALGAGALGLAAPAISSVLAQRETTPTGETAYHSRAATLVVAASNASPPSKLGADYMCDGTADEEEINAAIAALPAGGGKVMLTEGTFNVADSGNRLYTNYAVGVFINRDNVCLEGCGAATELYLVNGGNSIVIGINDAVSRVHITNLRVNGNKANQNPDPEGIHAILVGNNATYCEVTNCWVHDSHQNCITLHNGTKGCIVSNNVCVDARDCGVATWGAEDCVIDANITEGCIVGLGIFLDSTRNVFSNNTIIAATTAAIYLNHNGDTPTENLIIANRVYNCGLLPPTYGGIRSEDSGIGSHNDLIANLVDTVPSGNHGIDWYSEGAIIADNILLNIPSDGTGIIARSDKQTIIGNRIGSGAATGIDAQGNHCLVSGNYCEGATRGIALTGNYCNCVGNYCLNNGAQGGIEVVGDNNQVEGNFCTDNQGTKTQHHGVEVTVSADGTVVRNNYLAGNLSSAGVDDKGTNTVIRDNEGYVTENSGTSTQSGDGSTIAFKIAHGCAAKPISVYVTPGHAECSSEFHVSAVDGTNITVTFAAAPPSGTNNVVLYWRAEV